MIKVETYEVISLDEQQGAIVNELVSEEALALIESLDLDGQRKFVREQSAGDEVVAVRSPYRQMTAEEAAVFGAILPRRVELAKYDDAPVPLRVLQVAAHAKDLYEKLLVWCPENASDPDPLLVGVNGWQWWSNSARETFILARWGDELESLDALRVKAAGIVAARVRASIAASRAKLAVMEQTIGEHIDVYLRTGEDSTQFITQALAPQR